MQISSYRHESMLTQFGFEIMRNISKRFVAVGLAVILPFAPIPFLPVPVCNVSAEPIPTERFLQHDRSSNSKAQLLAYLARDEVQAKLVSYGVSPAEGDAGTAPWQANAPTKVTPDRTAIARLFLIFIFLPQRC